MSMGPAYFPFAHCHSRDKREGLSTFSERTNRFTLAFLFSSTVAQRRCSLITRLGCLSIFFSILAIQRKAGTPQEVSLPFRVDYSANANRTYLSLKQPSAAGDISHSANALPRARQASSAASSGVSVQITLSQTRLIPTSSQSFSQLRIHSPSPQP